MYDQYGFWTVDGSTDFGLMPAGIFSGVDKPLPIRLQHGNKKWGVEHIEQRHGAWLLKQEHTPASMVHLKLQQSGSVYSTEAEDKTKINMMLNPSALLVLRYIPTQEYLTVVTIYLKQDKIDGTYLGKYRPAPGVAARLRPVPVYSPPPIALPQLKKSA
ncbi:hypothetical protein [Herbaspirillum sp. CAH-3]|uniref:hypothetical protein n=1 Tax=Herbaspirillum sp. CAH-3 TaxID=2605746 RepID=UPI0012AC64FF|nr:hypothetical protein [Herbaspirillum sp. CAH-3]MRT30447.1 hypothetical protein [Herbaspirillum sp. CAH-3]